MLSTARSAELDTLARRIHVGSRVRYPGDVANASGDGAVIDVTDAETAAAAFTIVLDDGREFRGVSVSMFAGLRPWVILGGSRLSAEERAKLIAGAGIRKARLAEEARARAERIEPSASKPSAPRSSSSSRTSPRSTPPRRVAQSSPRTSVATSARTALPRQASASAAAPV